MDTAHKTLGLFLSLVWICIVILCVAFIAYLFIKGSSLFSSQPNEVKLDVFTETKDGITIITGSIESMLTCPQVTLRTESDVDGKVLTLLFTGRTAVGCSEKSSRVPFTASAPLIAPEVTAKFNGNPIEIIQQK